MIDLQHLHRNLRLQIRQTIVWKMLLFFHPLGTWEKPWSRASRSRCFPSENGKLRTNQMCPTSSSDSMVWTVFMTFPLKTMSPAIPPTLNVQPLTQSDPSILSEPLSLLHWKRITHAAVGINQNSLWSERKKFDRVVPGEKLSAIKDLPWSIFHKEISYPPSWGSGVVGFITFLIPRWTIRGRT